MVVYNYGKRRFIMSIFTPKVEIIEIKTPNCSRCKQFEPEYDKIKEKYSSAVFSELIFGKDADAMAYAKKYSIKSAPTFIIKFDENVKVVKQDELEKTLSEIF